MAADRIPEGFQQTEVGVIPVDWEVKSIGQICKIHVGRDLKEDIFSETKDSVYKYPVFSNTVSNYGLYGYYSQPEYQGDSLTVVGRGVGLGSAFSRTGGFGAIGRLLVLFPDENIDARYLTEYINQYISIFSESSGVPQLTGISFAKYQIPLPPTLAEQTAIAAALSDMDALTESLERLTGKKRAVKQGAMQELLRPKETWSTKQLGDVLIKIVGGGTPSRSNDDYWNGKIPWVTVKDFSNFDPFHTQEYITEEGLVNSASNLIPSGVLILSTRMAVGKAVIYNIDVCINQDLKALYPNEDMEVNYLYYWFQQNAKKVSDLASGSTVMGISLNDLKRIEISFPDKSTQIFIARTLSDMDAEIGRLEAQLAKYRRVKEGMMQELLTGKKRLI